MKTSKLPLSEKIEILELANKALRNYTTRLEEKLARYERIVQHCPCIEAEQASGMSCHDVYDEFYDDVEADMIDDDWDGLEDSDFEEDLEEDWEEDWEL